MRYEGQGRLAAAVSLILLGRTRGSRHRRARRSDGDGIERARYAGYRYRRIPVCCQKYCGRNFEDYLRSTCRRHWAPAQKLVIGANDLCRRAFKLLVASHKTIGCTLPKSGTRSVQGVNERIGDQRTSLSTVSRPRPPMAGFCFDREV